MERDYRQKALTSWVLFAGGAVSMRCRCVGGVGERGLDPDNTKPCRSEFRRKALADWRLSAEDVAEVLKAGNVGDGRGPNGRSADPAGSQGHGAAAGCRFPVMHGTYAKMERFRDCST